MSYPAIQRGWAYYIYIYQLKLVRICRLADWQTLLSWVTLWSYYHLCERLVDVFWVNNAWRTISVDSYQPNTQNPEPFLDPTLMWVTYLYHTHLSLQFGEGYHGRYLSIELGVEIEREGFDHVGVTMLSSPPKEQEFNLDECRAITWLVDSFEMLSMKHASMAAWSDTPSNCHWSVWRSYTSIESSLN